ncbi:hypothetical protein AHAS_Ahas08G0030800 [Arachis hypogaea]
MGEALEPRRVTFEDKMVVRKVIEEVNIPFMYIFANLFVGYFAGSLSHMGSFVPPKEKTIDDPTPLTRLSTSGLSATFSRKETVEIPIISHWSNEQGQKYLMTIAGDTLKTNITTLSALVLPTSEQLLFFAILVAKTLLKMKVKAYILDFKLAFEHFCIHAGDRAVLDELNKNLQLSPWYELAYTEANGRVKKGDREKNVLDEREEDEER